MITILKYHVLIHISLIDKILFCPFREDFTL